LRCLCPWVSSYCLLASQIVCKCMSCALSLSYIGRKVHPQMASFVVAAGIDPCTLVHPFPPHHRNCWQHLIAFETETDCDRIHLHLYIVSYTLDLLATLCLDSIHHSVCLYSSSSCTSLARHVCFVEMVARHGIAAHNHKQVFAHMCSHPCHNLIFVIVVSRYMSMKFRERVAVLDIGLQSMNIVVADMSHMTGNHVENTWCCLRKRASPSTRPPNEYLRLYSVVQHFRIRWKPPEYYRRRKKSASNECGCPQANERACISRCSRCRTKKESRRLVLVVVGISRHPQPLVGSWTRGSICKSAHGVLHGRCSIL